MDSSVNLAAALFVTPYMRSMEIYFFVSQAEPSIRAFTSDRTGANLPSAYSPWSASNSGASIPTGGDGGMVAKAVKRDGYFLVTGREPLHFSQSIH
jgi:hypothetical protein